MLFFQSCHVFWQQCATAATEPCASLPNTKTAQPSTKTKNDSHAQGQGLSAKRIPKRELLHELFLPTSTTFLWKRKQPINIQKLGGTPPTSGPQSSCGRVPFFQWKCPVCPADTLFNRRGITHKSGQDIPDVSGLPQTVPRTLPRHTIPTTRFLYVLFLYRFFLL